MQRQRVFWQVAAMVLVATLVISESANAQWLRRRRPSRNTWCATCVKTPVVIHKPVIVHRKPASASASVSGGGGASASAAAGGATATATVSQQAPRNWKTAIADAAADQNEYRAYLAALALLKGDYAPPSSASPLGNYPPLPAQGSSLVGYSAHVNLLGDPLDGKDVLAVMQRRIDVTEAAQQYLAQERADSTALVDRFASGYLDVEQSRASLAQATGQAAVLQAAERLIQASKPVPEATATVRELRSVPNRPPTAQPPAVPPATSVNVPTVTQFCGSCHGSSATQPGGGLVLGVGLAREIYTDAARRVLLPLENPEHMPKAAAPQPNAAERAKILEELIELAKQQPATAR